MTNVVDGSDVRPADAPSRTTSARWRPLLHHAAELATLAVGIPTVGALGASYAWPLELLSHFRVQYAVTLVLVVVVFFVLRSLRWSAAAFILLCVNAWWVAPFLVPSSPGNQPTNAAAQSLKLASINVYSGNPTPERVIDYIRETDPDIVVALEVTPEWEQRLNDLSDSHPHAAVQSRSDNFGIAMYSRWPLHDVDYVALSQGNHAIRARIEVDGESFHVVAAHPFPPMGTRGSDLRNRQLRQLANLVEGIDGPTIVAGDLNITPFSPYFDELLSTARLTDLRRGEGVLPTWPSNRWPLWIPIDHCLIREPMTARLNVGPDVGSDHRPLQAEIEWP